MTTDTTSTRAKTSPGKASPSKTSATEAAEAVTEATQTATEAAEAVTEAAQTATEAAQRTAAGLLSDGAYATLGAGERIAGALRALPGSIATLPHAARARAEAALRTARTSPEALQRTYADAVSAARQELDTYAARGRRLANDLSSNEATRQVLRQTETARSQVKGAVTSLQKVVQSGGHAVEAAAGRIGLRRSA